MKNISITHYLCFAGLLIWMSCTPSAKKSESTDKSQPTEIKTEVENKVPPSEAVASSQKDNSIENGTQKKGMDNEDTESEKIVPQKEETPPTPKKVKKKPKKFAKITFDSVVHRLPDVIEGDHFKHEFVFENTGEVPLSIKEAKASCGCTTPSFMFLDIAPGEKSQISIDYYSVNKDGPQEAEVEIKANTWPPTTKLTMLFNVLPREQKEQKMKKDSLPN